MQLDGTGAELGEQTKVVLEAGLLEQVGDGEQHGRHLEVDVAGPAGLGDGHEDRFGALVEPVELPQREPAGELRRGDQLRIAVGLGDGQRLGGQLLRR